VDIHTYEESEETMALLQILAIGEKEIEAGQTLPIPEVIKDLRAMRSRAKDPEIGGHAASAKAKK
jgi:hypothetical protein